MARRKCPHCGKEIEVFIIRDEHTGEIKDIAVLKHSGDDHRVL